MLVRVALYIQWAHQSANTVFTYASTQSCYNSNWSSKVSLESADMTIVMSAVFHISFRSSSINHFQFNFFSHGMWLFGTPTDRTTEVYIFMKAVTPVTFKKLSMHTSTRNSMQQLDVLMESSALTTVPLTHCLFYHSQWITWQLKHWVQVKSCWELKL